MAEEEKRQPVELPKQSLRHSLLKIGLTGSIVTGLCCCTPFLAVVFGMAGQVVPEGTDAYLVPSFAVFLAITVFGFLRKG